MSKFILKRDTIGYVAADFEEFEVDASSPIIPAERVKISGEEDERSSSLRKSVILRRQHVRLQSAPVDVHPLDFPVANSHKAIADAAPSDAIEEPPADESTARVPSLDVAALKEQWEAEWRQKYDEAVAEAKRQAYEEGYRDASTAFKADLKEAQDAFAVALQRFQETWENFIKRSETLLLEIALEIAQFILDAPLPERITHTTEKVLAEMLEELAADTPIKLSLNPLDLLRMQESGILDHIKEQFPALRWDPQTTLKEGNWIIQTPRKAIRRISDELLANLRDRFGLSEQSLEETEVSVAQPSYDPDYIPPVTNVSVSTTLATSAAMDTSLHGVAFSAATSTAQDASGEEKLDPPGDDTDPITPPEQPGTDERKDQGE